MKKYFLTVVIFVLAIMILPRAIKAQTTTDVIINSHINKLMMLERMKRNAAKKRATNKSSYRKSAKKSSVRKRTRRTATLENFIVPKFTDEAILPKDINVV